MNNEEFEDRLSDLYDTLRSAIHELKLIQRAFSDRAKDEQQDEPQHEHLKTEENMNEGTDT